MIDKVSLHVPNSLKNRTKRLIDIYCNDFKPLNILRFEKVEYL